MPNLEVDIQPTVVKVTFQAEHVLFHLADWRSLFVPLSWYPRLLHGTPAERENYEVFAEGEAVEWPDLDEHIGIEGVLAGRRSAESEASLNKWLFSRRSTGAGSDQEYED